MCFLFQKYFSSMCLMAPHPLRRAGPCAAAASFPGSHVSLMAVSCWPVQWPHSHNVSCCSFLVGHCSATAPSVSMTTSPTCVAQACLQMLIVVLCGILRRQRQSVHPSSRCSPRLAVGTPTLRSKYRPRRFKRARSARVAFPPTQCPVCPTRGVPTLLTRCDELPAHQAPALRGPVGRSAWRRLGSSVDAPPGGQALPLPALHVVGLPLTPIQRHCTPHSGSTLSQPRPNLAMCSNSRFPFSFCDSQLTSSSHLATMKSSPCTPTSESRDACPKSCASRKTTAFVHCDNPGSAEERRRCTERREE